MIDATQDSTQVDEDELGQIYLALKERDSAAWTIFYEHYRGELDRYFENGQVYMREDREDLLQETMRAIFVSVHTYDPEKSAFKNWVYGVAHNVMVKHQKDYSEQYKHEEFEIEENRDYPQTQTLNIIPASGNSIVQKAYEQLNEKDRAIINLRLGRDHVPWKELAPELNLGESTAKMRYKRAIKRLQQLLINE